MTTTWRMLSGAAGVALGLSVATSMAQQIENKATNDPAVGGQLNQCWGQVASGIAQLGQDDGMAGGGMGSHTRSSTAAANVGGFADPTDGGITFNQLNDDGNHGRDGVGNVSANLDGPHGVNPGDGGNGQHAINNSNDDVNGLGFSNIIDPVTGGSSDGTQGLGCDLVP